MDEKTNPAEGTHVPATDPAQETVTSKAPTAVAEQGVGNAVANDTNLDSQGRAPATEADAPDASAPNGVAQTAASSPTERASEADAEPSANAAAPADGASEQPAGAQSQPEAGSSDAQGVTTETVAVDFDAALEATATPTRPSAATADADDGAELTMEDVLAASDEQLARKPVHRGMIAVGQVIMLAQDGIVVDVGAKIEGLLPYSQLFEFETDATEAAKYFKPGDDIQVYVVRADIPNNTIVLSKKRADQERAWNLLQEIHDKGKPVEVEIIEKVRGGLVANLGIRAFLPASQVDVRRVNDLSPYVGRRLKVKIIELNRRRNRVIISRRSILEEEISAQKGETLKKLEPGLKLEGEVVEVTDFGVFVNLGGIDGLVHRSELTHGRFSHPRDVVNLGDKVRVEVLDMDLERERINLSMKTLIPNPWDEVLAHYHIGQRITGKVTNLTPFGAFVEIEPGLEGLIHVSEMSWTKRVRHPKEIVNEGDEVEAMILKIETQQQRISLGLRQTQPDPWSSLPDRYPPGTEITGPITGITDFGVFMEIEEGIEGLVHISELSHDHIENIADHFNRGDEITAVILNIDPVEQRASLSRKRLLPYTAGDIDAVGTGAPAARGSSPRRGRRGRRGSDIDYDYSYAAADVNTKTTTKLGDVYADLFAQFGLTDAKDDDVVTVDAEGDEGGQAAEATAANGEAAADASRPEGEAATAPAAPAEASVEPTEQSPAAVNASAISPAGEGEAAAPQAAEAAAEPVPPAEAAEVQTPEASASARAGEADTENAIDAAEAAALLTAAFREGRRPPKQADEAAAAKDAAEAALAARSEDEPQADDAETSDDEDDDVTERA